MVIKISVVCSSITHPVYAVLANWIDKQNKSYDIELVVSSKRLRDQGDYLFLVSCNELMPISIRARFSHTLILHASDLPHGRGWSPHIWEIINGAAFITLTLLEAEDIVDSGRIWCKKTIQLDQNELYDEINLKLFNAEVELIEQAISQRDRIIPQIQEDIHERSYYRKRTPNDSRLDITDSIQNQFNLLRVCDSERFPAFFEYNGHRYTLKIEKVEYDESE